MSKRAILRLDGNLEQGCRVTLEVTEENAFCFTEVSGSLPPAIQLLQYLKKWQQSYRQLSGSPRISLEKIVIQSSTLRQPEETCRQAAQELQCQFSKWLESESFHAIDNRLRESLALDETVQVLVRASDRRLHHLPWHCWNFIERYPQAEVALGSSPERVNKQPAPTKAKVRILAILGDQRCINPVNDRKLLEALSDAEVLFLVEPSRQQITHQLWEQAWDILFFAGHSETEAERGRIHLNPQESLSLEELKYGLRQAIAHGLQLAIFNSCDGLGLAYELEHLSVPQLIVMREPVPDRVAQEFLKRFLNAFAQGKSLYGAVREARERLQGLEGQFPCASWLPIIYQNPAVVPPTWDRLKGGDGAGEQGSRGAGEQGSRGAEEQGSRGAEEPKSAPDTRLPRTWRSLRWVVCYSLAIAALLMGVRYLGLLQPLEIAAFDQLLRLRPDEPSDSRLLIITVTDEDVQAQPQEQRRGSLSDRTLLQLLEKLETYRPLVIGLDIYRDYPVERDEPALAAKLKKSDRFIAVCKVSAPEARQAGVPPPPEIPITRLGFSDIAVDPDNIIRRHLLALTPSPSSPCSASYALSVQLALRYLYARGISLQYADDETWQLGKLRFGTLKAPTGGYQQVDDWGHQILLNYRSSRSPENVADRVTLGQVLSGQVNASAVKDRIVLIGTLAEGSHDVWSTPYRTKQGMTQIIPGVVLQAQMISQLLSAVLDGRPLIRGWAFWCEVIWIGGWSLLGGILAWYFRRPTYQGLAVVGAIASLFGISLALLIQSGFWVPLVPAALALVGSSICVEVFVGMKAKNQSLTIKTLE